MISKDAQIAEFGAFESQIYADIRQAINTARTKAFLTANAAMVVAYWEIGREIAEALGNRANYGKQLLQFLSERLTIEFGNGFTVRNLRNMRQFYLTFPIRHALRAELSWTHYRMLMQINEPKRREYYLAESIECGWTSRQLERQMNSFFYERLLATQADKRDELKREILKSEPKTPADASFMFKDPYILEFLDIADRAHFHETGLEQGLIDKLQEFLLELGKGFSFVARQKRITSEGGDHYYIDLVFYNYILKCFVVVELKTGKLTHQDVGQLDFYVRLFDDTQKQENDNPTIGIILCAEKDASIAKYSVLADKENLYASKYKMFLPTEEELSLELQRERELLELKMRLDRD